MIELGQHAEFIAGAWIGVAICLGALCVWAIIDRRRVNARLSELGDKRS